MTTPRTVGSLNGWWSVLLRLLLATWPLVVTWAAWLTVQTIRLDEARKSDTTSLQLYFVETLRQRLEPLEAGVRGVAENDRRLEALEAWKSEEDRAARRRRGG